VIAALPSPAPASDLDQLAALLIDAVDGGASTSFLPPLAPERALAWWRAAVDIGDARGVTLVARDGEGIAGCVQLIPAWAPNQPHRGEIAKLLVHRRARRRGLGRALMIEAEARARQVGLTLLTLDTRRGDAADALYRALGWTPAGIIPGYAVDRHGAPHDTIYFYRTL
jgi:acetyltransferase